MIKMKRKGISFVAYIKRSGTSDHFTIPHILIKNSLLIKGKPYNVSAEEIRKNSGDVDGTKREKRYRIK